MQIEKYYNDLNTLHINTEENRAYYMPCSDIENARKDLEYEPQFTYLKYLEDYKEEQRLKRFDELWIKK